MSSPSVYIPSLPFLVCHVAIYTLMAVRGNEGVSMGVVQHCGGWARCRDVDTTQPPPPPGCHPTFLSRLPCCNIHSGGRAGKGGSASSLWVGEVEDPNLKQKCSTCICMYQHTNFTSFNSFTSTLLPISILAVLSINCLMSREGSTCICMYTHMCI